MTVFDYSKTVQFFCSIILDHMIRINRLHEFLKRSRIQNCRCSGIFRNIYVLEIMLEVSVGKLEGELIEEEA